MDNKKRHASFNGLSRPALMIGVPIIPAVILMLSAVASLVVGMMISAGLFSLILPILIIILFLYLKVQCEMSASAIDLIILNIRARMMRIKSHNSSVIALSANKYTNKERMKNVQEYFKKQ